MTTQHRMATVALALAGFGALGSGSVHAAGKAEINYIKPEQFSDAGRNASDRERVLKSLSDYVQQLAAGLPDDQTLHLDVTDVDLAGNVWPSARSGQDLRVLNGGADWPRMTLRYTLSRGATTLKSGEAQLAAMNYMMDMPGASWRQGELAYEKNMLKHWFDDTFVPR